MFILLLTEVDTLPVPTHGGRFQFLKHIKDDSSLTIMSIIHRTTQEITNIPVHVSSIIFYANAICMEYRCITSDPLYFKLVLLLVNMVLR